MTFLAITYQCLEETDPTWTPLQVCNRSLSTTEVIVAWCRAWMEALAVGGRTPYGHVQPSDGRHRWKQGSQSALGTDYNDFSGNAYRERKSKLAYESPDDRECTFKPKLTKRSRELDRKRGKSKAKESVHRVYGSTVVDIFYSSSLRQTCFIVIVTFFSILKHPNKSFFNPIKYI